MTLGPDVGTAHITVRPSLRGWSNEVRRQLRREVEAVAQSGTGSGSGAAGPSGSTGAAAQRRAREQGARAGREYAGGFDREVRTRVQRALQGLPPARVRLERLTPEARQAEADLNRIRRSLEALDGQRIGVDIDAATALAQIVQLRAQLTELGHASPDVQVQADTLGAAAQLSALQAQIDALGARGPDIQADADTAAATAQLTLLQRLVNRLNGTRVRISDAGSGGMLSGLSGRTRILLTLLATLGPALLPFGAVLLSLAASATAAFTAAAGGIGILLAGVLGAIVPVIKAQSELEQKQKTAASASQAYASAQQQVAAAARGVSDAERSAARSSADAARALSDARRNAARATAQAETAVTQAQDRATDAQDALNDARRTAEQRLAAYRDQLRGAALDESGAALSVTAARDALNNALIDSTSSQLDIDQARQALAEAEFAYDQAGKRGKDLRAQARKDRAAGVDGDQGVIDARERLAEANMDVAAAERQLGEARADSARAVADAERTLARAEADGARQVAAAQEQLGQAQAAAAVAGAANAEAQANLAETMGKLSGPAAVFVAALDRAKQAWREFVAATAGDSFGLAVTILDMFSALLPNLVPLFRGAAGAVRILLDDLARFGRGEEGQSFLDWMTRRAPGAIVSIGRSIGNLLKGLGYLVGALAETDTGFLSMTRRFARWARNLDSNPSLRRFTAYVRRMRPVVAAALGAIADAFVNIVTAVAPIGTFVLNAITWFARAIAKVDPDLIFAVAAGFIAVKAASVLLLIVNGIVGVLAGALSAAALAGGGLAGVFAALAAVNPFVWVALAVVALVLLYKKVGSFRRAVNDAFLAIKRVVLEVWEKYLRPAFRELGDTAQDLYRRYIGPAFREIGRVVSNAWKNIIHPALRAFGWYLENVLIPVIRFLWKNIVRPYFTLIAEQIKFVYTRIIRPVFNAWWSYLTNVLIPIVRHLWKRVVQPVFEGIGSIIRSTWTNWIRPVFRAMRDFITKHLVPAFENGLDTIETLFEGLRTAAAAPVYFLVDTIYNKGIQPVLDAIPGVDIKKAKTDELKKAAGFALGGPVTGGVRGRDSVPAMLMPGEHVLTTAEVEAAGGHSAIFSMRRSLRNGPGPGQGGRGGQGARVGRGGRSGAVYWPLPGGVASTYRGHDGVDLNAPNDNGKPFYAAIGGKVTYTGYDRGYGNAVFTRGKYGELVYGHAQDGSIQVKAGDTIKAGQVLGLVGSTGNSTGPHLHFGFPGGTFDQAMAFLQTGAKITPGSGPGAVGLKGGLEQVTDRFAGALKAIARYAKNAPGWAKKVTTMGPWGELLRSALRNVGGKLSSFVNGKVPGSPMPNPFDSGGVAAGTGVMLKRTIRPERVLSPRQTELFERQIDTLDGWDAGMRRLDNLGARTGSTPQAFSVGNFRILDWETGLATFEAIAEDVATDVLTGQSNHDARMSDGELV